MASAVFKKKLGVMGLGPMGLDLIFSQKWVCMTYVHTYGCPPRISVSYVCVDSTFEEF